MSFLEIFWLLVNWIPSSLFLCVYLVCGGFFFVIMKILAVSEENEFCRCLVFRGKLD